MSKKILTTAALVAASIVVANAADPLISTSFTETGSALTSVTATATSSSLTGNLTASLSSLKNSANSTSTNYTTDLATVKFTGASSTDSTYGGKVFTPNINVATSGQWQAVFSYSGWDSAWGFSGIDLGTVGFNGSGDWQNTGSAVAATGTTSSTTTPENGDTGKFVKFTVEYALNGGSDWTTLGTYSIDVACTGSGSGATYLSRTTSFVSAAGTPVSISSTDALQIRISTSRDFTGGTFAGLSSIGLLGTAAIPEPSMFGLLAGLGALALVGARRRRK